MTQITNDWKVNAQLLLQAAKDIAPPGHPRSGSVGSIRHQALFEQYVLKLEKYKREGEAWINGLIDFEENKTGDRNQAIENVKDRRPVGAVSDPSVTGVVRKFWLACVSLNRELAEEERVPPEEFILEWLILKGYEELAEFLTGYPFWPLGLDDHDHWV